MAGQLSGKGLMKNMVTASVRGRVGDDITQCQDDEGSVRNCSNLDTFYFWNKFWCKSLGKVTSKVENLVFYKHETRVLFVEGFAEKSFFPFKHKVARGCSGHCLSRSCARLQHTSIYFQFFLKSCRQSLCVFNCRGIVFLTNPTVCLKSVFRPKKNSFSWGGLPPKCFTNSPRLWAKFCHFRRFSGTCCS